MSELSTSKYEPIVVSDESTVVAEYVPEEDVDEGYQSEAALEAEMIRLLQRQAYEYLPITSEEQMVQNLRTQLEKLNAVAFSDAEWERFFRLSISGKNDGIKEKTLRIQSDHVQVLTRDDGSSKNITLLDKHHIHNNSLQVINQYERERGEGGANYSNRYDVTVLVNGLPLVHIELKRRGVEIREAFNQIKRYQRDSFWAGSGLFDYVQLFVISNGTHTKYYSNSTRSARVGESEKASRAGGRQTSNSFEFTSWWADATNRPIADLTSFIKTFFAKHTLLNLLTKYCVLTADQTLLVMRPYQVVATERILRKIDISTNYKKLGTLEAGGYVWHTTGSGKTLTSFKTAQLASRMESVDKVLFVVDRKDLDYQTMREYDRFEKGSANSNTSTSVLKAQLEDPEKRIIITTIQKLSTFIRGNKDHKIYSGHVVIIFDECHRSQFGDMHTDITKAFKRYNLFGFTGTPIFASNSGKGGNPRLKTTEQAFGEKLHTYTIVDAITDKNVLPFRVEYFNTVKMGQPDEIDVASIDTESALRDERRLRQIVQYILEHFDQKTKRSSSYSHSVVTNVAESSRVTSNPRKRIEATSGKRTVRGFNALFATDSITSARDYYELFKEEQENLPSDRRLKIGIIYSYRANEAVDDGMLDDEAFDAESLPEDSRSFLESAIRDYNAMFGTSWDTSADNFQSYYKDLSQRLKNRELDLVIVVNMFLTGFDATTLNTLFVDKNLKAHGLIQAYSRTNRILNSVKTYGNIVAFRNLEAATNEALELFGNKEVRGAVLLKPYADYYGEYTERVDQLLRKFPLDQEIVGESAKKEFIQEFGAILKLQNILSSFDEFISQDPMSERQGQNFRSRYLDLHAEFRGGQDAEKEEINDDVVFEMELVRQVEVNVDYILLLVEKYREEHGNGEDRVARGEITRAIDASPTLRNKRDLVEDFVDTVSLDTDVPFEFAEFVERRRQKEIDEIIDAENLKPDEARRFIDDAFRRGIVNSQGTEITRIMKPMSRFGGGGNYAKKRAGVIERVTQLFHRFDGLMHIND
ncbi:type I restriction endonuclease subunit R [Kocuria sp. HSID16901]|uniref:type I restriction endonuclease subunit R n=1 Tax=Kocuria sp. HSID16901 TaxID=2419505 RepID=UPI00065FA09C|nr:type I restriction endonuclease subunit R [Kocuria sp. HSID16901]RUQ21890.1 type I restriction endonuclease subunit R [Kocuria sp. HSID16901]